jgi:endonuclease/exonuclease/phosphatase family metal-dependent hydrolase
MKQTMSLRIVHPSARRSLLAAAALALALVLLVPGWAAAKRRGHSDRTHETLVRVMSRNLYLGSSLAEGINATSVGSLTEGAGEILREVTANNFPVRARGLAQEILKKRPDLVGLQEAALWRTGPPSLEVFLNSGAKPTAATVRYDYLKELLAQLNKGKPRYRLAVSNDEFDFEVPADENQIPGDGPNGEIPNAEINGRLTMRDAILARIGAGVTFKHPRSGHFGHLLTLSVSGHNITVTRGWVSIDAKVRGSHPFRFVDTHLESFDPASQVPSIRALQAQELVAPGGPATSKLPVILVGDLNSDDNTVEAGDQQAYRALLAAGMRERSTEKPLGCCLKSNLLAEGAGGSVSDFDHQVDHIMTRDPKQVKLKSSSVTGLHPMNGYWDSDHGGLFSALRLLG